MRFYYPIILSSLFLSIMATSCEEPVDFDLDEETRLVVHSHFSANKALVVYVSETKPVVSKSDFKNVDNASISVFAGQEFIELLEYIDDASQPYYRSQLLTPAVDEVYTIKVNVPGHQPVTATNYIPRPVQIEDVFFEPTIDQHTDDNTVINFNVSVSIQDPEEYDNYYHLFFFQELIPYSVDENGDTLLSSQVYTKTHIDISLTNTDFPAQKNYDGKSFLIEDTSFNGDLVLIPFVGRYSFNPYDYVPGNFIVELRTVSKEYFYYYSSFNNQNDNQGDPLADYSVIIDNIENGEGIFAGYSTSTKSTKLSN